MLTGEPRKRYYIYPSCCCFRYSFDDLRSILADPFGYSALSQSKNYYYALDYPFDIQPFDMLSSQQGGGIIVAHAADDSKERWLPECVLGSIADIRKPHGMGPFGGSNARISFPAYVVVLEPENDPYAEYPTRDGRRFQPCSVTPENVDCCGDDIYWIVDVKSVKSLRRIREALGAVAADFQFQLDWLPDVPPNLTNETSDWFKGATVKQEWCRVSGASQGVGMNFAITVFCALHVRNLAYVGPSIRAIHLVASIEGRPNVRKVFWHPTGR
jgi:hypothetical protein